MMLWVLLGFCVLLIVGWVIYSHVSYHTYHGDLPGLNEGVLITLIILAVVILIAAIVNLFI